MMKRLKEPERGYAIPGVDFTPEELFREIRFHVPEFKYEVQIDKWHGRVFGSLL